MPTKKTIVILIMVLGGSIFAQKPNFVNASTSSSLFSVTTDNSNNIYVQGFVNGRIYVKDQYKDYTKNQRILGKLDEKGNFKWIVELENTPRDMAIINETLYLLVQDREKGTPQETYSISLVSYDLTGSFLNKKLLTSIKGTTYNVFADGKFINGNILIWSSVEEKTSVATLDGKSITNKMYSQYLFSKMDLSGNHIWDYKMDGGIDGFTELRVQVTHEDNRNEFYIVCYFGSQADVGIAQYKTDIMFKEKISLYYNKVFMVKLNKEGKPVKSMILGENAITVEDMKTDADGNIYFGGYFKGNDTFAKKQEDGRPYIGVKFFGKPFEYSEAESASVPDEDAFVAKIDSSWNVEWYQLIKGNSTHRVNDIAVTPNGITIGGYFSDNMKLNGNIYSPHAQNAFYGDAFYASLDATGKFGTITTVKGPKSDFLHVETDSKGNLLLWGTCAEKSVEINGTNYTGPSYYNSSYIYR